ncbi:lipoyl amidotransferase LIPT1, mitochondrial [Bacillus rossius redtenbacheri]|uniref:lipoyl amidotransferase LIPT1, mitochondrial n=1 Tax=Bacillus rossius redtenbacheri TaxID=93214 RepID=UPI002FDECD32
MAYIFAQGSKKCSNLLFLLRSNITSPYSCSRSSSVSSVTLAEKEANIKKSILISQSKDIYTNLALEDWLYKNYDFTKQHVLLVWRNSPCVVVGRHQNPWLEASAEYLLNYEVSVARRNSGGGAVYHDPGNVNFTFFTNKEMYNRRNNLEIISRALYREWGISADINTREDIVIKKNYKVSGTASKLGSKNAYHHCTLMVDVDRCQLSQALKKNIVGVDTNATKSIPSPVLNLNDVNSSVTVEKLLGAVGWEYLRTTPLTMQDAGHDFISQQNGFQLVNPTEGWFPGVEKLRNEFASWDWRFGKTPDFQVTRKFYIPEELKITITVNKGIIENVTLKVPQKLILAHGFNGNASVITNLKGQQFSVAAIRYLEKSVINLEKSYREASEELNFESAFVANESGFFLKEMSKSSG